MIAVSVFGHDTVARGLGTLAARLSDLSPALRELGARMVQTARPVTPFKSGALAASLTAEAGPQEVRMGSGLIYAGVQDRGWPARNIAGHHFLDAAGDDVERSGATEVESLLTSTARRAGLT